MGFLKLPYLLLFECHSFFMLVVINKVINFYFDYIEIVLSQIKYRKCFRSLNCLESKKSLNEQHFLPHSYLYFELEKIY